MPGTHPDLKKGLDEIRQDSEPPVDITLTLDAELYHALRMLSWQHRQPLKASLIRVVGQDTTSEELNSEARPATEGL